jgi:hypothetical protein
MKIYEKIIELIENSQFFTNPQTITGAGRNG